MFKTLGFIAWSCCLLVLGYQGIYWTIYATWPSVTLSDVTQALNINFIYLVESLSFEMAAKATYLTFTTELSLFLWWVGVVIFASVFASKIILKK